MVRTPSAPLGAQSPRFCEEPALRGAGRPEAMHAHGERGPDGGGPGPRGPAREGPTGERALGCGVPPPPPLRGPLASSSPPARKRTVASAPAQPPRQQQAAGSRREAGAEEAEALPPPGALRLPRTDVGTKPHRARGGAGAERVADEAGERRQMLPQAQPRRRGSAPASACPCAG